LLLLLVLFATSDSQTCHKAGSWRCWRRFYLGHHV